MTGDITLEGEMRGLPDKKLERAERGQFEGRKVLKDKQAIQHLRGIIDEIQKIKTTTLDELDACIAKIQTSQIPRELLTTIKTRRQLLDLGDEVVSQKSIKEELQIIKIWLEEQIQPPNVLKFRRHNCSQPQVQRAYEILRRYRIDFSDDDWRALPLDVTGAVDYDEYIKFLKQHQFNITEEGDIADQIQQQAESRYYLVELKHRATRDYPILAGEYSFFQKEPSIDSYRAFIREFNADHHQAIPEEFSRASSDLVISYMHKLSCQRSKLSAVEQTNFSAATMCLKQLACTVPQSLKSRYKELKEKREELDSVIMLESKSKEYIQTDIDEFKSAVTSLEEDVIECLCDDLWVSDIEARKIYEAGQKGWETLVVRREGGTIAQNPTTAIPHLKIIQEKDGTLKAYYGIGYVGQGGVKRTKFGFIIGGEPFARSAPKAKTAAAKQAFLEDIADEMPARELLKGVENTVEMFELKYTSTTGEEKQFFVMKKYDESLSDVCSDPSRRKEALRCCKSALKGLTAIHLKRLVHGDFKPENVLLSENTVAVTDFATLGKTGTRMMKCNITPTYCAPEALVASKQVMIFDPSLDMYSCGIMLFKCSNYGRWVEWGTHILSLQAVCSDIKNSIKKYRGEILKLKEDLSKAENFPRHEEIEKEIARLQNLISQSEDDLKIASAEFVVNYEKANKALVYELRQDSTLLNLLIADLLNMNPQLRPHDEETVKRLDEALSQEKITL